MTTKITLNEVQLWWPAWQRGIPFALCGFARSGKPSVKGDGYEFELDRENDCWLVSQPPDSQSVQLMPISTSKLMLNGKGEVHWDSLHIRRHHRKVTVIAHNIKEGGYSFREYDLENLWFEGYTYEDDE